MSLIKEIADQECSRSVGFAIITVMNIRICNPVIKVVI